MTYVRYRKRRKSAVPRDINNACARKEKSMKNQVNIYRARFPGEEGNAVLHLNNVTLRNQYSYWIPRNMAEH